MILHLISTNGVYSPNNLGNSTAIKRFISGVIAPIELGDNYGLLILAIFRALVNS